MDAELYPVPCPFEDCLYHVRMLDEHEGIYCRHPEKCRFLGSQACPLYVCDWAKKLNMV